MALYAIERLDDAVRTTRAFLFPVDRDRWLRLAVMALFVAGGTGGVLGSTSGQAGTSAGAGVGSGPTGPVPGWAVAAALAFVVLALALAVLLGVVSATMEFALVESLRSERVAVREYVGRFWRRGARLFGFQLGVALLGVVAILALATVSGRMLASNLLDEEVIAPQSQLEIVRTTAPALVGQSLAEADVRARTNCTVIAAERDGWDQ